MAIENGLIQHGNNAVENMALRIANHSPKIKNPRRKQRGIEDLSLKDLRMRGNKSPAPPVEPPQGAGN